MSASTETVLLEFTFKIHALSAATSLLHFLALAVPLIFICNLHSRNLFNSLLIPTHKYGRPISMSTIISYLLSILYKVIDISPAIPVTGNIHTSTSDPDIPLSGSKYPASVCPRPASTIGDYHAPLRGFVLTTANLNLKGPAADPQVSLRPVAASPAFIHPNLRRLADDAQSDNSTENPSFDLSLISDTSTFSSSFSEDDTFSPSTTDVFLVSSAADYFPSPPRTLFGLGISGLSDTGDAGRTKENSKTFDGLGLVGIMRAGPRHIHGTDFRSYDNELDNDDNVHISPISSPYDRSPHANHQPIVSQTFLHEIAAAWVQDPSHHRALEPVPECADEPEPAAGNDGDVADITCSSLPIAQLDVCEPPEAAKMETHASLRIEVPTAGIPTPVPTPKYPRTRRDLSAATISSGLKRSASCSGSRNGGTPFRPILSQTQVPLRRSSSSTTSLGGMRKSGGTGIVTASSQSRRSNSEQMPHLVGAGRSQSVGGSSGRVWRG